MSLPLRESGSVTLDSTGAGSVRLRPDGPAEKWQLQLASVKCSSNTSEASCKIYIGPKIADQYYVDGTLSGSTGDSTSNVAGHIIGRTAQPWIWASWSGGDSGAEATLTIAGTKDLS